MDFFVGSGEQDATDDPIQAFGADGDGRNIDIYTPVSKFGRGPPGAAEAAVYHLVNALDRGVGSDSHRLTYGGIARAIGSAKWLIGRTKTAAIVAIWQGRRPPEMRGRGRKKSAPSGALRMKT
ncbi:MULTISPECIES: hypothetical protein [Caballeronia]|uniref:Uncharacterized protein n=1 Tax=Caballeronia jiangsuensis TaxID=1458357 RepID=A0ABW9CG09_9BURK|nr:hypothetical protein [Caballeronia sp. GaOx3]